MAPTYCGIGGIARKLKEWPVGIDGIVRQQKEVWAGVGGVQRKIFTKVEVLTMQIVNTVSLMYAGVQYNGTAYGDVTTTVPIEAGGSMLLIANGLGPGSTSGIFVNGVSVALGFNSYQYYTYNITNKSVKIRFDFVSFQKNHIYLDEV